MTGGISLHQSHCQLCDIYKSNPQIIATWPQYKSHVIASSEIKPDVRLPKSRAGGQEQW